MLTILETNDYIGLSDLFYRNGLEITPGYPSPKGLIKCWEVVDSETGDQIAGMSLEKRAGEFVIGDIAVENDYRRHQLGTELLNKAIEEVKSIGGRRIMLVAKVPQFFKTAGFIAINREDAPNISNCMTCKQFYTECFPEVMYLDL